MMCLRGNRRVEIRNLGPIKECCFDEDKFVVFMGSQASGKSTVARVMFFFKTVKDDVLEVILRRKDVVHWDDVSIRCNIFSRMLRLKFLEIFGVSEALLCDMRVRYFYSQDIWIEVGSKVNEEGVSEVYLEYSQDLKDSFEGLNDVILAEEVLDEEGMKRWLGELFCDDCETVFIPAGRNVVTLLGDQLAFLFSMMDEEQKSSIDYCTRDYVERIFRLKPQIGFYFNSLKRQGVEVLKSWPMGLKVYEQVLPLIFSVMRGRYSYANGMEGIYSESDETCGYVRLNYASSGQQEVMWLFNVVVYYLLKDRPIYVILEEPEAHLYPDAQKEVTEFVSFVCNQGDNLGVFMTTHSPYVLGEVNNLLYAGQIAGISDDAAREVYSVISEDKVLRCGQTGAYFADAGVVRDCIDSETGLVDNEVIDGASVNINREYEELFEIGLRHRVGSLDDD